MVKDSFKIDDLLRLIDKAKESGVNKLDIKKDGSISIEFSGGCKCPAKALAIPTTQSEEAAMEKIAKEVTEEEEAQLTLEHIEELQINDPQELERLIELGYVAENENGDLIPSFK